jgi:hypothetical protein
MPDKYDHCEILVIGGDGIISPGFLDYQGKLLDRYKYGDPIDILDPNFTKEKAEKELDANTG